MPIARTLAQPRELLADRYQLLERVGSGGFGSVWRAEDRKLQREVAVKVMPLAEVNEGERESKEARASARLNHPAIVTLYESFSDQESLYLISEFVAGNTLASLLKEDLLSDRDVVEIAIAICDALTHAHRQGVIHRDIKPQNILIPDQQMADLPAAKLADFGIARLIGEDTVTQAGDVVGTLAYMSPEQAAGERVTAATDTYSLAVVIYESLTGRNPFRGKTPAETARKIGGTHTALAKLRADLPAELATEIDRALLPTISKRCSLEELRETLVGARNLVSDEPRSKAQLVPESRLLSDLTFRAGGAFATGGFCLVLGQKLPEVISTSQNWLLATLAVSVALLLPRAGGTMAVATIILLEILAGHQGSALILICIALLSLPLLLRSTPFWTASLGAVALGSISLAGLFPFVIALRRSFIERISLATLGAVWLVGVDLLVRQRLYLGKITGTKALSFWQDSLWNSLSSALWPLFTSGALLFAFAWAIFTGLLPVVVRGRRPALDLVFGSMLVACFVATQELIGNLSTKHTGAGPVEMPSVAILGTLLYLGILYRRQSLEALRRLVLSDKK